MIRIVGPSTRLYREFIRWLAADVMEIRHKITIEFAKDTLVGVCCPPLEHTCIVVQITSEKGTLDTIAHELCHYEQYRDGRKINERGVKRRAAAIVRRWDQERAR